MPMEKTFDAASAEPRIYAEWEQAGAFTAGANAKPGASPFSIMLPPPNVTGFLHAGHAFNHTLMDILVRWHRMRGRDVLWQPGLDHAGIATQLVVERELARTNQPSRRELGREKFLEKVMEWKARSGGTIIEQDKRLGASMDWSREAFTMDPAFHEAVIRVFVDMYEKGLIYRGKRLVNWDPHFETAISDLEVENKEVDGHMWHFKYRLADGETYEYVETDEDGTEIMRETRDYISIATTRPETMLGDGAVAVHPSDSRYAPIVGKMVHLPLCDRVIPIVTDQYPDPDFGSGAVKITGAHDFNDYQVAARNKLPMYRLMDMSATMRDDGAPYAEAVERAREIAAGAEADAAEIDSLNLVPEKYRGLDRFEARKLVVEDITNAGLAVEVPSSDPRLGQPAQRKVEPEEGADVAPDDRLVPLVEPKKIMQPFGDRSKVVIEPMLTDQWFVDAEKVVGPALDAVRSGETKIIPESGEKVYFHWLENIEPWCISRQLWWGHRIPVWYGFDLGTPMSGGTGDLDEVDLLKLLLDGGMVHSGDVQKVGAELPEVTGGFQDEIADLPSPLSHARIVEVEDRNAALHALAESLAHYATDQDPSKLVYPVWRDPDVLDTWFSSGLWPIGTLGWPGPEWEEMRRYHPTSVLVTGQDILFFWVARMMMMQYAVVGEKPFDTVYLHGLVRDEKGVKMSKVLGNVIDPLELIDEYGADSLRFANAAMAALGGTLKLSRDTIKGYRNFGTKLWNAFRFAEMNGTFEGRSPQAAPPAATATVNRWIIGETAKVREEVDAALDGYRFNEAASALYGFVWGRVCDWYLELSKPLFGADDAAVIEETRATLAWVLDQCLILLHPIMPFVTEELWGTTAKRAKMLIHADWPTYTAADLVDPQADSEMGWVIELIESVRSVRGETNVPAGADVPLLLVELDAPGRAALGQNDALIRRLARIDTITEVAEAPKGSATIPVRGGSFALPLADLIDVGAERTRLQKSVQKLEKELGGLRGRLSNPNFAQSAPEEVVAETRANLERREADAAKLRAALARLDEIG
ncbi:valine--tRNA ligase [Mesobaculum littorinae]|uniref:Valine--tRNA ligase n=1 Tax=Mesobaculum littorinae TaxID=2486419 RepID=A0A438AMR4_9RHOB|nr:valine--tRNA ligase [Mesobaculum littorinae]RVV99900.1 valine--tRNA ligase [Mesobaculum littorinae]